VIRRGQALALALSLVPSIALVPAVARAGTLPDATERFANCAAFWLARDEFARSSAYLAPDPTDVARGEAFRALGARLTRNARLVDNHIGAKLPMMRFMFQHYIVDGDAETGNMNVRLAQSCEDLSTGQPEFDALRKGKGAP